MIYQTLPLRCQLMRTPSSAASGGSGFVEVKEQEMALEPAEALLDREPDASSFLNSPGDIVSGSLLQNATSTAWETSEDEGNTINGVADLFLQLQQHQTSPLCSPKSVTDDEPSCQETPTSEPTQNVITTALDIAALRKSLTGRPRLKRVCHICGRECPSRHKLQRHLSTHSEERPYNCSICGKAFKWTEYLSKHMRTQHGSSGPTTKHCMRHRSVDSPAESRSSAEPCSPKTRCCHASTHHQRSTSSNSGSLTQESVSKSIGERRRISTASDTTANSTTSAIDVQCSTDTQDNTDSTGNQQTGMNNTSNSNMIQTDPYQYPYSANQYHPNGYYPGFYPLNPYHPYLNAGPYNFPMSGHPYPNAMMQNFPYDPMMQGFMMDTSIGTDVLTPDIFDPPVTSQASNMSNAGCQTQEMCETPLTSTNNLIKKKSPVKIINLTSKRDAGIQCEVGDETVRALFDEDGYYKDPMSSLSPGSNTNSNDEAETCAVCKYPCEEEGCNRAYVHRKDLTRHMRISHGINPTIMEPRVVEAPIKPHLCSIGDCNKSYYHLKDLRRHQRQCHLSALSGGPNYDRTMENGISSLRYPCDFDGCGKSYIHKKDLIRHKRMFHNDASNHPSIPEPVIVVHMKKVKRNSEERSGSEGGEKEPKIMCMDSLTDPRSSPTLPTTSNTPLLSDINNQLSTSSLMDSISAAVANMVNIEEISSQILNLSASSALNPLPKETDLCSTADLLLGNMTIPSPSSDFTSNGLLSDTNLLSTS